MALTSIYFLLPPIVYAIVYLQSIPVELPNEVFLESYDFIVVGAGSAGSVLANRLTEKEGWNVLLLEAGGEESPVSISEIPLTSLYMQLTIKDWQYTSEPQEDSFNAMVERRSKWPRGKGIGGSSTIHYMLYVRGNKKDYDNWESLGNPGWGYQDVLEYFKKSEDNQNPQIANTPYHATGGYLTVKEPNYQTKLGKAFLEAGQELGYEIRDINGEFQTGFAQPQGTIRDGRRCSTGKAFLRPARKRGNLQVTMEAHVTRVLIEPVTKVAYGVEFVKKGKVHRVRASKEVILSAGTINSPQLLLLSGIGPKEDLEQLQIPVIQDLQVGRNLQDHVCLAGLTNLISKPDALLFRRVFTPSSILQYFLFRSGPLSLLGAEDGFAFVSTKYVNASEDYPDIKILIFPAGIHIDGGSQHKRAYAITDDFYDKVYRPIEEKDAYNLVTTLLRPKSRGIIKLRSTNPFDYPLINPNYFANDTDMKTLIEGVKIAWQITQTSIFQDYYNSQLVEFPDCANITKYTDEYWECMIRLYTLTMYAPTGTCKMGPYWDQNAVVDPELKVYGVQGLRVIDASIMPNVVSGDLNAPTIMIAEKGADLVKQTWATNATEI